MKNLYFVQSVASCDNFTAYLPYASGCLIAYALRDSDIAAGYRFNDILFMREKIDDVVKTIREPFMAAFSCNLWNYEYSRQLAKKIKESHPACLIVFGGHYISHGSEVLDENPFIDFSIYGEGERPFAALLKALLNGAGFGGIENLTYRGGNGVVVNPAFNNHDIADYPSPYLSGIFDSIFKRYPGMEFHAIIETNRGCPYLCAYCEWCYTKNIRYFPLERVKNEIRWMSENRIEYCYCADANFGISKRDVDIAAFVIETRKTNGYPKIFRPTYAKNSNETVFEAGRLLNANGADKGVTIAYQSLNETTLELIGRKELNIRNFAELEQRYFKEGIPTYTEMILGLPGETYESFCGGLCRLLDAGQHNSIAVYQCQIYSNALMGQKEYREKYGIQTARVPIHGIHYMANFNGVQEYYDIVIGTASMNNGEWVKANLFSFVLQAFHSLGLLRCFAIYLKQEQATGYDLFYNRLLSFILGADGTSLQNLFLDFEKRLFDTKTGDWTYIDKKFGKIGWYFDEGAFLELVYSWDVFWEEIQPFLALLDIPPDLFGELLEYQKLIIRRPDIVCSSAEFGYDFYDYFEHIYRGQKLSLKKRRCRVNIHSKINAPTWEEYAPKIILGGKRRGETLYTNEKNAVTVEGIPDDEKPGLV